MPPTQQTKQLEDRPGKQKERGEALFSTFDGSAAPS